MIQQSLISQINAYNEGLVDRALAEVALDFMISLEGVISVSVQKLPPSTES